MSKRGDYQLDPFEEHGTIDLAEELESEDSSSRWPLVGAALLLLAIGAGWAYWYFYGRAPEPVVEPVAAPAPSEPVAPPVEEDEVDLPVLEESDGWVRDVVGQLSEHPQLATWLLRERLIERLVAAAVNVADGSTPRAHVGFLRPRSDFEVQRRGGRVFIDPDSYRRYDLLAEVIASLHVEGTAQVYRNLSPLLDEAYRNLGYPEGDFDAVAAEAVKVLLSTPVVEGAEVEGYASSYQYVDPRLEGLSEAQKQFLRLGPENLTKVQNQVRRIARRAGLDID